MSSGSYETVPNTDAKSYDMVDPTGSIANYMKNIGSQLPSALMSMNNVQGIDQNALMNQFLSNFGNLQGAVTEATSPLTEQLNSQVDRYTNQAGSNISNQFANLNSLYSSGFGNQVGEAAGKIAADAGVTLGQAQLGLLNPLAQTNLSGIQSSAENQRQMQQQNAQLIAQLNAQLNQPQYANPDVAYQPSPFETAWNSYILPSAQIFASSQG